MSSRREHLLDAAIAVLARGGARDLTHRAVDHQAQLPPGSASNVFRTRVALVEGIFDHLIDQERRSLPMLPPPPGGGAVDERFLRELAAGAIDHALGPGRQSTLARKALFQEAAHDPSASQRLAEGSRFWWDTLATLLRDAGAPDPERRGRLLLAYVDGIIADQLARPESDFDAEAAIAPAIHGILASR